MATQVQFVIDAAFKLDDLLRLELHQFEEEVGEIVDRAQKEEKMEQTLAKLKVCATMMLGCRVISKYAFTNIDSGAFVTSRLHASSCHGKGSLYLTSNC